MPRRGFVSSDGWSQRLFLSAPASDQRSPLVRYPNSFARAKNVLTWAQFAFTCCNWPTLAITFFLIPFSFRYFSLFILIYVYIHSYIQFYFFIIFFVCASFDLTPPTRHSCEQTKNVADCQRSTIFNNIHNTHFVWLANCSKITKLASIVTWQTFLSLPTSCFHRRWMVTWSNPNIKIPDYACTVWISANYSWIVLSKHFGHVTTQCPPQPHFSVQCAICSAWASWLHSLQKLSTWVYMALSRDSWWSQKFPDLPLERLGPVEECLV